MTTATARQLEVDDYLRNRTELLVATEEAIEHLDGRIHGVPGPTAIRWRYIAAAEPLIELSMCDAADWSGYVARLKFPLRHLSDPVSRTLLVSQVFDDLISERSKKTRARVDDLWRSYIREYGEALDNPLS
jgi:hypothetical protein